MRTTGAVFQPELIDLMRAVLDEATAMLPEAKRTLLKSRLTYLHPPQMASATQ
jgi:hypothetical protein